MKCLDCGSELERKEMVEDDLEQMYSCPECGAVFGASLLVDAQAEMEAETSRMDYHERMAEDKVRRGI